MQSEIDLENQRLLERIRFVDLEIANLQNQMDNYTEKLRWKRLERQRLLDSLIELNR